jgi:hypothetical protein
MFVYLILGVRQLIEKPGKPQCFLKTDSTAVVLGKKLEKFLKKLFETQVISKQNGPLSK